MADVLVQPRTIEEVQQILKLCRKQNIPYYIIGNGSNLLVGDGGIRGVVIEFGKEFASIQCENGRFLHVQAGCMLGKAASFALQNSLTGMEFAAGIPGTIGGAILMNAGAYGGEMKDIVKSVVLLTPDGERVTRSGAEMEFGYRKSMASRMNLIILEAILELQSGESAKIQTKMQELAEARRAKQPLEYPSAGSTFKRPEGYFAGKLIMDAGLAGYRVGDAQVSEKHCGFVINRGHATAKEFATLMQDVTERVYQTYGVTLEPEVRRLGEFTE
jgi:UDP-N-acetylmuramate dehydrogenase